MKLRNYNIEKLLFEQGISEGSKNLLDYEKAKKLYYEIGIFQHFAYEYFCRVVIGYLEI